MPPRLPPVGRGRSLHVAPVLLQVRLHVGVVREPLPSLFRLPAALDIERRGLRQAVRFPSRARIGGDVGPVHRAPVLLAVVGVLLSVLLVHVEQPLLEILGGDGGIAKLAAQQPPKSLSRLLPSELAPRAGVQVCVDPLVDESGGELRIRIDEGILLLLLLLGPRGGGVCRPRVLDVGVLAIGPSVPLSVEVVAAVLLVVRFERDAGIRPPPPGRRSRLAHEIHQIPLGHL